MNPKTFKAISDPKRREIIGILTEERGPTISEISNHFKISRQATTKHINILADVKIIYIEVEGREKHCYLNPKPLKEIYDWVSTYKKFWNKKLDSLERFLDKENN